MPKPKSYRVPNPNTCEDCNKCLENIEGKFWCCLHECNIEPYGVCDDYE